MMCGATLRLCHLSRVPNPAVGQPAKFLLAGWISRVELAEWRRQGSAFRLRVEAIGPETGKQRPLPRLALAAGEARGRAGQEQALSPRKRKEPCKESASPARLTLPLRCPKRL